jgi:formyl-CoA transferase
MNDAPGPLDGVRILDFTQVFMGPSATQLLGDYGADVIKVERPGTGDLSRTALPDPDGLDGPIFLAINRNKRSVTVDMRSDRGRDLIRELVGRADVLVSNFRPGVMEKMGLGYDAVRLVNPRLVWASGSGFGEEGPYVGKGGQDVIAQAYSGLIARRADSSLPPSVYPTAICDYPPGMHLVHGILMALLAWERTGQGQMVRVNMFSSALHLQMQEAATRLYRGHVVNWAEMPLSGAFPTSDGAVCIVGAFKENPLRDICSALGLEDLSRREAFATIEGQFENKHELQGLLRERLLTAITAHWVERLEAVDILCAPVQTLSEALDDEQAQANQMITTMPHARGGEVRVLNPPITLSDTPFSIRHRAPRLGEHNGDVLREVGWSEDDIARATAEAAVR